MAPINALVMLVSESEPTAKRYKRACHCDKQVQRGCLQLQRFVQSYCSANIHLYAQCSPLVANSKCHSVEGSQVAGRLQLVLV